MYRYRIHVPLSIALIFAGIPTPCYCSIVSFVAETSNSKSHNSKSLTCGCKEAESVEQQTKFEVEILVNTIEPHSSKAPCHCSPDDSIPPTQPPLEIPTQKLNKNQDGLPGLCETRLEIGQLLTLQYRGIHEDSSLWVGQPLFLISHSFLC